MAKVIISTKDRQNNSTSMSIGADDAVSNANVSALKAAIDAIILGSAARAAVTISTVVEPGSNGPSTDKDANRGNKWLFSVFVADDKQGSGDTYNYEIGTADNSLLPTADTDFIDLTAGAGLALKSAFEAVYRSGEGNTGVLTSVQQVNRGD